MEMHWEQAKRELEARINELIKEKVVISRELTTAVEELRAKRRLMDKVTPLCTL